MMRPACSGVSTWRPHGCPVCSGGEAADVPVGLAQLWVGVRGRQDGVAVQLAGVLPRVDGGRMLHAEGTATWGAARAAPAACAGSRGQQDM
jgi:hypothetical protein